MNSYKEVFQALSIDNLKIDHRVTLWPKVNVWHNIGWMTPGTANIHRCWAIFVMVIHNGVTFGKSTFMTLCHLITLAKWYLCEKCSQVTFRDNHLLHYSNISALSSPPIYFGCPGGIKRIESNYYSNLHDIIY